MKLQTEDWDFSDVPDDELPACLLWEYGRESSTFVRIDEWFEVERLSGRDRWSIDLQKRVPNSNEERKYAEMLRKELQEAGFDMDLFRDRYEAFDLSYTGIYETVKWHARPWADPWIQMPARWREQIKVEAINPSVYGPISQALVGDLEALWILNSGCLDEVRSDPKKRSNPHDDSEDMALLDECKPLLRDQTDGLLSARFVAAFSIDFEKFTDSEILSEFSRWLEQHRPKGLPKPSRRGKKHSDERSALEWLGIMRALHHFQWRSPRFPSPLKSKGESACYKARKLAERKFHSLFPFLEKHEHPLSWKTRAELDRLRLPANSR